jgi:hypothetical protein
MEVTFFFKTASASNKYIKIPSFSLVAFNFFKPLILSTQRFHSSRTQHHHISLVTTTANSLPMAVKKLFTSISLVLALIGAASGLQSSATTNFSQLVTWDQYSLKISGERQFIFSGEFHVSNNTFY